ncbi:hypothetical protein Back2_04430 [Nocardioides baekrokdamisoli]|uniref:Uncharacterized protein n=1 Tax=Nocardioides baekrokdamisoli TaxID=1804624 RepID=A0A3G9ICT0_9ACTN|nr:hypothetical protein [Nocardioides baekrokdamisoli]BBH16156.1 hypothetical protein Back2_04430 [Nocardioides baekrokdamisoli]
MEAELDAQGLTLRLSHQEALLLGISVRAGYETVSQAEYYIRHGLSEPAMEHLAAFLIGAGEAPPTSVEIPIEPGVEEVENPRRPRPGRA